MHKSEWGFVAPNCSYDRLTLETWPLHRQSNSSIGPGLLLDIAPEAHSALVHEKNEVFDLISSQSLRKFILLLSYSFSPLCFIHWVNVNGPVFDFGLLIVCKKRPQGHFECKLSSNINYSLPERHGCLLLKQFSAGNFIILFLSDFNRLTSKPPSVKELFFVVSPPTHNKTYATHGNSQSSCYLLMLPAYLVQLNYSLPHETSNGIFTKLHHFLIIFDYFNIKCKTYAYDLCVWFRMISSSDFK